MISFALVNKRYRLYQIINAMSIDQVDWHDIPWEKWMPNPYRDIVFGSQEHAEVARRL